jgi:hypothetical protein
MMIMNLIRTAFENIQLIGDNAYFGDAVSLMQRDVGTPFG